MTSSSSRGRGTQAFDLFGAVDRDKDVHAIADDALSDPQWGSLLRNRRRDKGSVPDLLDSNSSSVAGSSSRSSLHPLLQSVSTINDSRTNHLPTSCGTTTRTSTPPPIPNVDEISRPNLFRLTSDLEREVQAANVISRSSVDDTSLRTSTEARRSTGGREKPKEVEVIVHEIQPRESLQGIALRYGIELSTLRKVNKLWPTDPLHLRRQLYVPLDACRWAKASEMFVRGPGEGEITILNKKAQMKKNAQGVLDTQKNDNAIESGTPYAGKGKGKELGAQVTPLAEQHNSAAVPLPRNLESTQQVPSDTQILSIIRIPTSELSFFPKNANKPARQNISPDIIDHVLPRQRTSSPGSPSSSPSRNSPSSTVPRSIVSSPSSLRNSFESITRPFSGGRLKSMTPIDESGSLLSNDLTTNRSTQQPGIELLPRRSNDVFPTATPHKKAEQQKRRASLSSGWGRFFSVADDGLDPTTDIGNFKI